MLEDTITVDEHDGLYTTEVAFDLTDSVAEVVAMSVAAIRDCDPTDLPPLADAVDPDALNGLFEGADGEAALCVTFAYAGFDVTVTDQGAVTLRPD